MSLQFQDYPKPPLSAEKPPLVVTLAVDAATQAYFNHLRKQHFPPERNYLDAHLTLFNALPDLPAFVDKLETTAKEHGPFEAIAQQVMSLGNGTALKIVSPELTALHRKLRDNFFDSLSNQDRQNRNFHITIQNKVDAETARKLQLELSETFEPLRFTAEGIRVWRYMGGPWQYLRTFNLSR